MNTVLKAKFVPNKNSGDIENNDIHRLVSNYNVQCLQLRRSFQMDRALAPHEYIYFFTFSFLTSMFQGESSRYT